MGALIDHLDREWAAQGWPTEDHPNAEPDPKHEDWEEIAGHNMQAMMYRNLREIIETFENQGHSGTSANYAIAKLTNLLAYMPISPLTGEDSEWEDHGGDDLQNLRCSAVFKSKKTGIAHYSRGKVFRHPDGACFTSIDSRVPIEFPYTPHTEYVDVDDDGNVLRK